MKKIEDYKGTKTAILCTTQKEWDGITALLGYKWNNAEWFHNNQKSCINCEENLYSDLNYYNEQKYTILPALDFLNNEEQQFIVGKWYKIGAYKAYFKFKSITTEYGFDKVSYFDCIWNGGTLRSNNSICNTQATNSAVLLTDLTEIQQFLPSNHPDKIKEQPKQDLSTLKDCYIELNSEDEYNALSKFFDSKGFILWNKMDWNIINRFKTNPFYFNNEEYFMLNFEPSADCYTKLTLKDLEQYGFKYVKPLEAKLPITGKVYDSVPEYYKYIAHDSSQNFTEGKIYKCRKPMDLEAPENFIDDKGLKNGFCGSNYKNFTPSTEAEYLSQEGKSKCVMHTGSYVTGIDPYMNETIEVGDEVEIHTNSQGGNPIGSKVIISELDSYDEDGGKVWYTERQGETAKYVHSEKYLKLIKKANHQTTTVSSKRVDCISPQVNTNLSSLIKIRNSKPLQKLERTRLIIQKTKTIKLNQNG
jgi:hypothetical protein